MNQTIDISGQKRKSIPEKSWETKKMEEQFGQMNIGDILTYKQVSEIIGNDAQRESRYLIYTAIKNILEDQGIYIVCIPRIGWKRIPQSTALQDTSKERKISTLSRKRLIELKMMDYTELDKEEKIQWNVKASHMNLIRVIGKNKSVKKLEDAFAKKEIQEPFNVNQTLLALGWKGNGEEKDKKDQ